MLRSKMLCYACVLVSAMCCPFRSTIHVELVRAVSQQHVVFPATDATHTVVCTRHHHKHTTTNTKKTMDELRVRRTDMSMCMCMRVLLCADVNLSSSRIIMCFSRTRASSLHMVSPRVIAVALTCIWYDDMHTHIRTQQPSFHAYIHTCIFTYIAYAYIRTSYRSTAYQ